MGIFPNGDPTPQRVGESTNSVLKAYNDNIPNLIRTTSAGILPMAAAQLGAAQEVTPEYNKLTQDLSNSNLLSNAQGSLATLQGPGKELANTAQDLDKSLNPQFYADRANTSQGYADLLKQLNPANTNVAAERAVNAENVRSGNLNNTNATNTVKNAMQFGDESLKRSAAFGAALQGLTSTLQPAKSNIDPYGKPTTVSGASSGAFNVGDAALSTGNNLLNNVTGLQQQSQALSQSQQGTAEKMSHMFSL